MWNISCYKKWLINYYKKKIIYFLKTKSKMVIKEHKINFKYIEYNYNVLYNALKV